jgi:large subunit ribosomal protein L21
MYAVIETGGKQYRVEVGTELEVELLDVEPGKTISLDRVLLVADGGEATIGQPLVDGAAVSAEVVRQARGDKVIAFKYRPKARRRVKKGHRQELTVLRVSDIVVGGKSAAKTAAKAESDAKTERQRLEEAAEAQAAKDAELAAKLAAPKAAKAAKAAPKRAPTKATESADAATTTEATETAAEAPAKPARRSTSKAKADASGAGDAKTAEAAEASGTAEATPKKKPAARPRTTKKDE